MKNAIMAVTKSAYATFHEPPWCAPRDETRFFLTMTIGRSLAGPDTSGSPLASHLLQCGERRPLVGLDVSPRKFNGRHGRVAARKGEDCRSNAVHVGMLRAGTKLHGVRHGRKHAITEQDSQERSNESCRNTLTNTGRITTDLAHGDDHAEYGRDDAESRHCVANGSHGMCSRERLLVMLFEVSLENIRQVVILNRTGEQNLERIGE